MRDMRQNSEYQRPPIGTRKQRVLDEAPGVSLRGRAVVLRPSERAREPERYLIINGEGPANWTHDPQSATAFASMREATRAALHLPADVRAFSMPFPREVVAASDLH